MSEVIAFPRPPIAAARPMRFGGVNVRREYSFAQVCAKLALGGLQRTMIETLRALHDQCGMPAPKNPRLWKGIVQHGSKAIDSNSRWCALEFDAWDDGRRNPPPAMMAEGVPPLPPLARADMAERARILASR